MTATPATEDLEVRECWRRLTTHGLGRVCFRVDDRVHVVLAPYVVRDGRVYCRAAAFGPVARRAPEQSVTLQVDDVAGDVATWSVAVTGTARLVTDADTTASLWTPVRRTTREVGHEQLWITVDADEVSGRRIRG